MSVRPTVTNLSDVDPTSFLITGTPDATAIAQYLHLSGPLIQTDWLELRAHTHVNDKMSLRFQPDEEYDSFMTQLKEHLQTQAESTFPNCEYKSRIKFTDSPMVTFNSEYTQLFDDDHRANAVDISKYSEYLKYKTKIRIIFSVNTLETWKGISFHTLSLEQIAVKNKIHTNVDFLFETDYC